MRFLTFLTVSAGWLEASLISVDKKFLHFFTFSIRLLLLAMAGEPAVGVPAAAAAVGATTINMHHKVTIIIYTK